MAEHILLVVVEAKESAAMISTNMDIERMCTWLLLKSSSVLVIIDSLHTSNLDHSVKPAT